MRRLGGFYNLEGKTRWERAAESLSNLYPGLRSVAWEVEYTYNNYLAMHKYDYQEDEVKGVEGTVGKDNHPTFEKISLIIAAMFGDEESLRYLLTRESRGWYPAFHQTNKYWEKLSRNTVLQNHPWQSVRGQTICLLSEINKFGGGIPHLNKYKITPLLDFTHEQNMFLIEKALKLETLIPFTQFIPPRDMADMLSESWEPSLSPKQREMLDIVRQLQAMIELDPSKETFWKTLEYVRNILELRKNYDKAMALHRGDEEQASDGEHSDEEYGDKEHGDEEQVGDEERGQKNSMPKQPDSATETKADQLLV
ncbi:hypothetical protein GP486_002559, partial [Trichoglossum hirsutum]